MSNSKANIFFQKERFKAFKNQIIQKILTYISKTVHNMNSGDFC